MAESSKRLAAIAPERIYPLQVFQRSTGLGPTRMREGRLAGINLRTIDVGRRKFVRGVDGIDYIERLSTLTAK